MAKRTLNTLANLLADRVDKDRADTTFIGFAEAMLNLTLQEINAEVPWSRWLMDETSLTATVSGTQYVVMPSDMDIDSFISLTERTNTNLKLTRIDPETANMIDPGRDLTGDEILWWFQRVETVDGSTFENRIYFLHQPDSADTITAIFGVLVPLPATGGTSILPEKYEPIQMEGALSKIWERLDPENTAKYQLHRNNFLRGLEIIRRDANNAPGQSDVLVSHRPPLGSTMPHGPSFPANYNIL